MLPFLCFLAWFWYRLPQEKAADSGDLVQFIPDSGWPRYTKRNPVELIGIVICSPSMPV